MSDWKVAFGKKRGGPFDNAKLKALISAGSIPNGAFIRANDDSTDWRQFETVEWLRESAEPSAVRYCIECDARLILRIETAGKETRCPNCGALRIPVDYLNNAAPPIEDVPPEPWGKYDLLVLAFSGIALCVAIAAIVALFFDPWLAVLLGFVFVATGSGLFAVSWDHRSRSSKYVRHIKAVEQALTIRTESLNQSLYQLNSLRRAWQKIEADLKRTSEVELENQRAVMAEQLDSAKKELENQRVAMVEQLDTAKKALETRRALVASESAIAKESSQAVHRMAERFLDETRKWWTSKLNGENYQTTKDRLRKAIEFCRKQRYTVPAKQEADLFKQLQADYELVLRREHDKAEQKRIREQMREEQKVERELKQELDRIEAEQDAIRKALAEAMKKVGAEHSAEVELLRAKLQEAEERGQRTKSQAELTRVGCICHFQHRCVW